MTDVKECEMSNFRVWAIPSYEEVDAPEIANGIKWTQSRGLPGLPCKRSVVFINYRRDRDWALALEVYTGNKTVKEAAVLEPFFNEAIHVLDFTPSRPLQPEDLMKSVQDAAILSISAYNESVMAVSSTLTEADIEALCTDTALLWVTSFITAPELAENFIGFIRDVDFFVDDMSSYGATVKLVTSGEMVNSAIKMTGALDPNIHTGLFGNADLMPFHSAIWKKCIAERRNIMLAFPTNPSKISPDVHPVTGEGVLPPAGYMVFDTRKSTSLVASFAVEPDWRGAGLGTCMIRNFFKLFTGSLTFILDIDSDTNLNLAGFLKSVAKKLDRKMNVRVVEPKLLTALPGEKTSDHHMWIELK